MVGTARKAKARINNIVKPHRDIDDLRMDELNKREREGRSKYVPLGRFSYINGHRGSK